MKRRNKMGMMKEFRDFAVRGNVVDMAVGVVIGGAFGKIISSLVENVIMPPIGMIMGGVDFSNRFNTIIDFLIIAFVIFLVIRQMNRAFPKEEAAPARTCQFCKEPIADDATRCPHCTAVLDETK